MERRMAAEKRAHTDARKASTSEPRGMAPSGYRWLDGGWAKDDEAAANRIPSQSSVGLATSHAKAAIASARKLIAADIDKCQGHGSSG